MFDNLTDQDAFWAARVILSFTKEDLQDIVKTAEYSDPKSNDYILRVLMDRRQLVARYWLGRGDGLSDFSIRRAGGEANISFHDLMADHALASADLAKYSYQIKGNHYQSVKKTIDRPEITIDREILGAASEHGSKDVPVEISIWTHRRDFTSEPVRIYFDWSPNQDALTIRRIARG